MLTITGHPKRSCDGLTRRNFLHVGSAGIAGVSLPGLLRADEARRSASAATPTIPGLGRAKSLIVLFLYGAPSQMDSFDPKPNAPVEARGEFGTIETSVPGLRICEHLPRVAQRMDRVTLIRSLTHPYPTHAVAYALSGVPFSEPPIEANAVEPRHWPYFGSVLDYLWAQDPQAAGNPAIPRNMYLPWPLNSRTNNRMHGGLHAAWLGTQWNPVIPDFVGEATREQGAPSADGPTAIRSRFDPHDGITRESTFRFQGASLLPDVSFNRLENRRLLLEDLNRAIRKAESLPAAFDRYQQAAFSLIASSKLVDALDVTREDPRVREEYGYTLFGQGALAARRLIQAGVRVATVFWDEYGPVNTSWDTHFNNFPRLREGLLPTFDQVYSALLDDLDRLQMLDETLVLVLSEHGRTPQLSNVPGGGREHWGYAYSGMATGAGVPRGQVIGATDKQGGYPVQRPLDPKDILATTYHLLGFDPRTTRYLDREGRERHLLPFGDVIPELIG